MIVPGACFMSQIGDPYWNKVVFLAHLDAGPTFIEKANNLSIVQTGILGADVVASSSQTLFGGNSARFDPYVGSNFSKVLHTTLPYTTLDFSGAFTIEMWVYAEGMESGSTSKTFYDSFQTAGGRNLRMYYNSSGTVSCEVFGATIVTTETIGIGAWNFIVLSVHSSGASADVSLAVNGVNKILNLPLSTRPTMDMYIVLGGSSTNVYLPNGAYPAGQYMLRGALRECRITKDVVRSVTSPTVPFPNS
jgi:hypothetical protein